LAAECRKKKEACLFMKTAAEYRAMAEECFRWAREAKAKKVRVSLRKLAQVWLDAASKLDVPALDPNAISARRRVSGDGPNKARKRLPGRGGSQRISPSCRCCGGRIELGQSFVGWGQIMFPLECNRTGAILLRSDWCRPCLSGRTGTKV